MSAWFRMAMLCLLCLLGLWGNHTSLHRPALDAHTGRRAEQRRKRLLKRTQATLLKMRTNAAAGRRALDSGGRGGGGGAAGAAQEPPDPHEARRRRSRSGSGGGSGNGGSGGTAVDLLDATLQAAAEPGGSPAAAAGAGAAAGEACAPSQAADQAYACFSQAVRLLEVRARAVGSWEEGRRGAAGLAIDISVGSVWRPLMRACWTRSGPPNRHPKCSATSELPRPSCHQELELRPGSIPAGFIEAGAAPSPRTCVFPDEQAAMFCGWAEAALRKARCELLPRCRELFWGGVVCCRRWQPAAICWAEATLPKARWAGGQLGEMSRG